MKTSTITIKMTLAALGTAVTAASGGCTYYEQPPRDEGDSAADDGGVSASASWDDGGSSEESESSGGDAPSECADVELAALDVLQTYCAGCHKAGPNPPGNFDYVTDLQRLVSEGKVVPGDSGASPLFVRVDSAQMPPPAAPAFPAAADIAVLQQWIDDCAAPDMPGGAACEPDHRIGIDGMLAAIGADIGDPAKVSQENRENIRYFTLSHLYDSGLCKDELNPYREALSKTLNSLSTGTTVAPPVAIDADETIYRIDLRDYGWDAAVWAALAAQSPYAIEFTREEAIDILAFTGEQIPVLRGDWLAAVATAPPYYNTLLLDRLGAFDRVGLQVALGVDINTNIANEIATNADDVARAGFLDSGVSENNRLVERHEIPGASNRALWISYDFGSNADEENLFASPLAFQEAGSELIFSLPNGLHGYMIVRADGVRLDVAPDNIVTDPAEPTGNVVTGRSCFGCHDSGMNAAVDELGPHVASSLEFDDATKEAIENLHPAAAEFDELLQFDSDSYAAALTASGVPIAAVEPIGAVFEWYQLSVDLPQAAGELGITEDELLVRIGGLSADLQPLAYGTVKRNTFELNFAQAVCDLQLGVTNACR